MECRKALVRTAWLVPAMLASLGSSCLGGGGGDDGGVPPGPPTALVWIDSPQAKLDTAGVDLTGGAECDGCPPPTEWMPGACPAIECPSSQLDVTWTNEATGATGAATHGIWPHCYCPPFSYGYCYSACDHYWYATVPLTYGGNTIKVTASGPGYADGSASADVQRVPVAPTWTAATPGAGQITLEWSTVPGATSYDLYWSTTPYGWSSLCTKIADVASPYTQTGLEAGVTYYYFVTALVGEAESFDSQRIEAIPN